jgi:D-alanine--poly(phosphoribitol) ligase subunit 2
MDTEQMAHAIERFVADNFMVDFGPGVDRDTDLFEAKYLDSFGFVDLVTWLEQDFRIKLTEDDLAEPAMGSVNGIVSLVKRRLGDARAAS